MMNSNIECSKLVIYRWYKKSIPCNTSHTLTHTHTHTYNKHYCMHIIAHEDW